VIKTQVVNINLEKVCFKVLCKALCKQFCKIHISAMILQMKNKLAKISVLHINHTKPYTKIPKRLSVSLEETPVCFQRHCLLTREGWPLLTVETEPVGDSISTHKRGPSFGLLGSLC
jgi:hypothetical protein